MSIYANPLTKPPLDESFYSISAEELEFFKVHVGIENKDALKEHIIAIQKKAYEIYGYPCIRFFSFIKLKISHLPAYPFVIKLIHEHQDAILLDIGCCFGTDLRKAVADGWPVQNIIGFDLHQGFWEFGHKLFTTPQAFPAAFIAGDAFDTNMIASRAPFLEVPEGPRPDLASLSSLSPLQGHVSAIYASSFFHLFDEARQKELAQRIATLLSPIPGSIIFGSHVGRSEKGRLREGANDESTLFCHSPETWRDLWDGEIFDKGLVEVDAKLKLVKRPDTDKPFHLILWSITRQ